MTKNEELHHIGGVYTEHLCGSTYNVLSWGACFEHGLRRLEFIADDHTYTFKTTEQRFDFNNKQPYGPQHHDLQPKL
jgi:hypothetical protein